VFIPPTAQVRHPGGGVGSPEAFFDDLAMRARTGPIMWSTGSTSCNGQGERFMNVFTDIELEFLRGERRLARIATVGPDGMPHVTPVGWSLNDNADEVHIRGRDFANTKKFRDVARTGRAAIVIDEVLPPWRPRGVEIRGRAEALAEPEPHIRIHPTRVVSWGLEEDGRPTTG
jgi:pyridoxamine 5'-phosphate oxidase family protein